MQNNGRRRGRPLAHSVPTPMQRLVRSWRKLTPHHPRIGWSTEALLPINAESSGATDLPGDVAAAHDAHHLAADLPLDHRPPWDQAEAEPVIDHGKAAAGELR